MPTSQGDFPASVAGSSRASDLYTDTPIKTTRTSTKLGQSPLRTRPPITFNPVNAQSWVVTQGGSNRNSVETDGFEAIKSSKKERWTDKEIREDEDPFEDYLDYESDRDYLSETGSPNANGDDSDEAIETVHFGSDAGKDDGNETAKGSEMKRKPSVRTIYPDPPDTAADNFPNSPSPYSPTPPTALPQLLSRNTANTLNYDAPSMYSRPSWRGSQFPGIGSRNDTTEWPVSQSAATIGRPLGSESQARARKSGGQPPGHIMTNRYSTAAKISPPPFSSYGTFHPTRETAQSIDLLMRQPAYSTPVPVSTSQAALDMPSGAHNGSFGAIAPETRPQAQPAYTPLHRFWVKSGPFVTAISALVVAIFMTLTTRGYSTSVGSVYSVPNRVFSLTAAGDSPGDVKLGLEGWCLGEHRTNCTAYWDLAFGTTKDIAIPSDSTLRLADSAMLASTMFAYLFASYTMLALLFQVWLFRALGLGWTFPTDQSEESTLRDIYTQAQTRELREVYWCWWGHREAPIGHIFWLLSMIGSLIGFGSIVRFSQKLPECRLLPGAYVPLVVQVVMIPCTVQSMLYFFRISESIRKFDRSLELLFPPHLYGAETPEQSQDGHNTRRDTYQSNRHPVSQTGARTRHTATKRRSKRRSKRYPEAGARNGLSPVVDEQEETSVTNRNETRANPYPGADGRPNLDAWSDPYQDHFAARRDRSAVTPSNMTRSDSSSQILPSSSLGRSGTRNSSSSNSDWGVAVAERWRKAYYGSISLKRVIDGCRAGIGGSSGDYTLSEDGLLYIYLEEEEGAAPRLVPPEGAIREELIEDAVDEVAGDRMADQDRENVIIKVKFNLGLTFWWDSLEVDVDDHMRRGFGAVL